MAKQGKEGVQDGVKKRKARRKPKVKRVKESDSKQIAVIRDRRPILPDGYDLTDKQEKQIRKLKKRLLEIEERTEYRRYVPNIHKLIMADRQNLAAQAAQRGALMMLTELIPIAEGQYRKFGNERAAYALNALISQMREIIADIRAENDTGALALRVCDEVVKNSFTMVGQNFATSVYHLREQLKPMTKENSTKEMEELVNNTALELVKYVNSVFQNCKEQIFKLLTSES